MAMVPFYQIVGHRAVQETRTATVPANYSLPAGNYAFIEFYCDDPECDCRRVIFQVWREDTQSKVWATITYGWDTPEYYAKWSRYGPGAQADEMASATLEQISPQTELSHALLDLLTDMLLPNADYVARLKRHYQEACPNRASGPRSASAKTLSRRRKRRRR